MNFYTIISKIIKASNFIFMEIIYSIKKFFYFKKKLISSKISKNGYLVLENFISEVACNNIIKDIDKFINKYPEEIYNVNDKNSDLRLWGFENFSEEAKKYLLNKELSQIITNYDIFFKNEKSFVLGAKLIANNHHIGSGGGKWHKDRTNRKFKYCKALVYLNDVDENNGPFQYVKGSHKSSFLIKNFIKKNFDFSKKNFSNEEIDNNFSNNVVTFSKPKGTVIIFDGTGIHRGKPIKKNYRYALTNYYRNPDEIFPYKMISQKN